MGRNRKKDNPIWRKAFGDLLKEIMILCALDYHDFCNKYSISESTFRYWCLGKNLPQLQYMEQIKKFFCVDKLNEPNKLQKLHKNVAGFLESQGAEEIFFVLKQRYPEGRLFAAEIFAFYRNVAKHRVSPKMYFSTSALPTGKTQAVVFDFDGTLTTDKFNRTTWESIWMELNYTKKDCQELHQRFDKKEISHSKWCEITEKKFKERRLHKTRVEKIASDIHLIDGVQETLKELSERGIKIYIVSGSIDTIIREVLGDNGQYIEELKANYFKYDSDGFLIEIVGTKYDFEGKAFFILQIAEELNISPQDILFVGNSINDRFAYRSGARTLCINPRLTDPSNSTVWHNCIQTCENLREIFMYL